MELSIDNRRRYHFDRNMSTCITRYHILAEVWWAGHYGNDKLLERRQARLALCLIDAIWEFCRRFKQKFYVTENCQQNRALDNNYDKLSATNRYKSVHQLNSTLNRYRLPEQSSTWYKITTNKDFHALQVNSTGPRRWHCVVASRTWQEDTAKADVAHWLSIAFVRAWTRSMRAQVIVS